jgi:hypothetical protein
MRRCTVGYDRRWRLDAPFKTAISERAQRDVLIAERAPAE